MKNGIDIALINIVNGTKTQQITKGKGTIIAFIDSGIDVLHQAFQDKNGKTRIVGFWDQTDNTGTPPVLPDIDSFGTEHTSIQINRYIQEQNVPSTLGRDPVGHGTLVASIAAGKAVGDFKGGLAPEAEIVFVKVDPEDPLGLSVRYSQAFTYIENIAALRKKSVVVNLSQGTNLGPRDGSYHHEIICDNFLEKGQRPNFALVKSAGNQRQKSQHAQLQGPGKGFETTLKFRCSERCKSQELIEIWFDSQNKFKFQLVNPSGKTSNWVSEGIFDEGCFSNSNNDFFIMYRKHSQNNPQDSRLLITITSKDEKSIEQGRWRLKIKGVKLGNAGNSIDAWIEKSSNDNDLPSVSFISNNKENITLTTPGTFESLIVTGSIEVNDDSQAIDEKSSIGPTRKLGVKQPILLAPGVNIYGARAGSFDQIVSGSGTSFAASHVSGGIALISSALNINNTIQSLTQNMIIVGLQSSCIPQEGWNEEKGFGFLSVDNLYEYFIQNFRMESSKEIS